MSPTMASILPPGCELIGAGWSHADLNARLRPWCDQAFQPSLLVVLAATRTAEVPGISAAGATTASRRYTAIADAELLLHGPAHQPHWPLPPLPAGVSPALISWAAAQRLALAPEVAAIGLHQQPPFPHLRFEAPSLGAADCLSSGQAMSLDRVEQLWERGRRLGSVLRGPLVLAECVPGGTTTAQAVLSGLGVPVDDLVSGSARQPPLVLKQRLVADGLKAAALRPPIQPKPLVAAVGDPFQALAAGLIEGAMESGQPLMLAGGSQMLAVLALALTGCAPHERPVLASQLLLGTTAWLAVEQLAEMVDQRPSPPAFPELLQRVSRFLELPVLAIASGLRLQLSRHQQLRDYELGHVKEGVGAGGLALLAQLRGIGTDQLLADCDRAMDALLQQPGGCTGGGSLGSEP